MNNNVDSVNSKESKKQKRKRLETITLMHVNVRGLKSKIKDVISIADDQKFDIMVLTETKLTENENKLVPGYKNHRLSRKTRAGGVIIRRTRSESCEKEHRM